MQGAASVPALLAAASASRRRGRRGNAYELLYPMLDLTTTLDPLFNVAYRFGAIFLAEPFPGGAGRPDLAIALLEKGLQAKADKWEYMQDAGFVHYWWRQDYKAAAGWFDRASKVPGRAVVAASRWRRRRWPRAATAQSSRLMWEAIRESAEIDWLRNDAERRLTQLRRARPDRPAAEDRRPGVGQRRRAADDWMPLVRGRVLPGLPADPSGTPYEIDPNGRVMVSQKSPLFRCPESRNAWAAS